ncbi:MAG: hypothetical protein ACLQU4_01660, partial [Limisphaerales bacterium]
RKKSQSGEEGRRIFSESVEENPLEEDPILNRQVCIHSISPVAAISPLCECNCPAVRLYRLYLHDCWSPCPKILPLCSACLLGPWLELM